MSNFRNTFRLSVVWVMAISVAAFLFCAPLEASNFREGVSLTPSLTFNPLYGTTSAPQNVILTNMTHGSLPLQSISLTGTGFTMVSNNCPEILAPGASCTIAITFGYPTPATFTGALTFKHDDGPQGSISTLLTGTATAPVVTLKPNPLTIPAITAGSTTLQTVQLTNTGNGPLNLSSVVLSGSGVNLFTESNTCGSVVAPGSTCNINVGFAPLVAGSYSAMITLTDNALDSPQTLPISATATPCPLSIDTTNSTDWKINNCAVSLDFNPSKQRIFHIFLAGHPEDLTDQTNGLAGIYMDNTGIGGGPLSSGFNNAGTYLDWWVTEPSTSTNGWTYALHYIVYPNDPGIHTYFSLVHSATDIAASVGQVQWVYRSNLSAFNNTYSLNADLSNPNPVKIQLPSSYPTDAGRNVQDATQDLHNWPLPPSFTRQFYTKYDYSTYNYLHQAHGTYGSTFGNWAYFPSNESLVAGPTKQNLSFTNNLLMIEAYSNHLDNGLTLNAPAGTALSRLFGPFYIHFNTFGQAYNTAASAINTPDDMYADALQAGASFAPLYDQEQTLLQSGYVPSTSRGSVSIQVNNVAPLTGATPKTAWAVLSDPAKNFQFSSAGYQYWADISATGSATFTGVAPGTYRLSVYVLGQFGELRRDGIVVSANQTTTVPTVTFVPEKFGTETVFTIGTPDRSSHEFLHGHDAQGHDLRDYWGSWNYWADFAANGGSVVYNATSGPNGAATNDLSKWNYNHWGSSFDPGLFAGVYSTTDLTSDGYIYAIPSYVASLPGAKGTNGVGTGVPAWTVHFASPADVANYQPSGFAVMSVGLACTEGSYVVTLNGTNRTWGFSSSRASDCAIRSGLSGYYQWFALQFPASVLKPAGQDNVMTIGVSQVQGAMDDAMRLELSTKDATSATTGWNDYDYSNSNSSAHTVQSNDALPNQ